MQKDTCATFTVEVTHVDFSFTPRIIAAVSGTESFERTLMDTNSLAMGNQ